MTNPTYEVIDTPSGNQVIMAYYENGHTLCIPADPANSDYQAYLNKDNPVEHFTPSLPA